MLEYQALLDTLAHLLDRQDFILVVDIGERMMVLSSVLDVRKTAEVLIDAAEHLQTAEGPHKIHNVPIKGPH